VENVKTPFTQLCEPGDVLKMPIAHHAGNYFAPPEVLNQLWSNGQIILRYCDHKGSVVEEANPNGSVDNIAGIANQNKNVFGLMPHPERAIEPLLGSSDGRLIFQSIINAVKFVETS
jgi:phosphoribosylformylglycinamidine synthase